MDGQLEALQRDAEALVGTTLGGRYRVDGLIGIGGMGAVLRVRHLGLDRDVAMKVLHRELTRDPQVAPRFDREARSASRLDHPNCLRVMDYGSTPDGMKFMVMQLMEGIELAELLGQPLPPARATELILQIVLGLEHAHEHGVVHRDLKPENVFVTRNHEGRETLKLFDFGIAKLAGEDGGEKMTRVGLVFGTPQYMSPEQATGMEGIDHRADLYSAGIMLYEMLAGTPPFESDDPVAIIRMQVSTEPPPLPEATPIGLASIVAKLLAKRRDDRYASASEVRMALQSLSTQSGSWIVNDPSDVSGPIVSEMSLGTTVAVPTLSSPAPRSSPLRKRAAVGAGLVLAALIAWRVWPTSDDTPAPVTEVATPTAHASSRPAALTPAAPTAVGPMASELEAIDALLGVQKTDEAWTLLEPLRARYPGNVDLMRREARLLAGRSGRHGDALALYAKAIGGDPSLLDDPDLRQELLALMREPELGPQALEVAVGHLGPHGHPFLLELVNREKKVLRYEPRHRALAGLDSDPEARARIDQRLNIALDLMQAEQSPSPCETYREALAHVRANPDPYYRRALRRAKVPTLRPDHPEDEAACRGLAEERDQVRGLVGSGAVGGRQARREEKTPAQAPKRRTSSNSGGTQPAKTGTPKPTPAPTPAPRQPPPSRSKECNKPFAIFKKKCRK